MANRPDPTLPPDDEARALARGLLAGAAHAALAWTDPDTGTPGISRVALGRDRAGVPLILVSGLAPHSGALRAHPACALMVGEVGDKGDPLTHPRLMLRATAAPVDRDGPDHADLRALWLQEHPKARVYVDLPDFRFFRLTPQTALLNGGFARAYRLEPADVLPPQ